MTKPDPAREERFRELYAAHFDALLAYAVRRTRHPDDAADLVAETFLVAWRRLDAMPAGEDSRLWLYVVARHVRSNAERSGRRRERLGERLRQQLTDAFAPDPATQVTEHADVRAALQRLGAGDRELLMLSSWEGLEPREIAHVLDISPTAVRTRLSRARRRLRDALGDAEPVAGHEMSIRTVPSPEEGR
ncbi:RNA polymerase sigma factor [Mumia zhuanghuii]|uniref:RNA polymerase sigma factor n=1 Tax=Mumia zhuanghuii TaxID=2585211 RepID=A0A5C4M2I4_9ACTN|nr:RNA polymerase sigma factor [Mumia zhuanghuii]TNC27113.1 RNA polymerase sigma factor [Mumia zhuanghuii]